MGHLVKQSSKRIRARVSDNVRGTRRQTEEFFGAAIIRLSPKDARKVLTLINNPPKPNNRLKDAVKAFKDTVRGN